MCNLNSGLLCIAFHLSDVIAIVLPLQMVQHPLKGSEQSQVGSF